MLGCNLPHSQVPRMTMTAALLLRLRRIYFVLFLVVYLAWITKVMLLMDAGDSFPYFWFCVLTLFMISGTGMLIVSLWRRSHAPDEEDLDV